MSVQVKAIELPASIDAATNEIDLWRGRCLNCFARTEAAVGETLEFAVRQGKPAKLRHLRGQQLADLGDLAGEIGGTPKQKATFQKLFENWQSLYKKRAMLAHGCATASLDRSGEWVAVFDLVEYRGQKSDEKRWAIRQREAETFQENLSKGFAEFSSQLGQLRKRIAPKSQ